MAPTAFQVRCRVLERAEDAVQVDVQNSLERRLVGLSHRSVRGYSGIGDDDVDAAHGVCAIIDRRPQRDAVAHIGFPPGRGGPEIVGEGTQPIGLEADEGHMSTAGGGKACHRLPDSSCGSGDYELPTGQVATHQAMLVTDERYCGGMR